MQFHILSFEGPDKYAHAGGIGSRITGLADALAHTGYETHLWFVGDPRLSGHDKRGQLSTHRWCQWLSQHHPHGVYDGEKSKAHDYATSLPPFLTREALLPALRQGQRAVVLAEEWHTANAVLHLDHLLREAGVRQRVCILWNANNTFGFDGIDWARLRSAAVITTVSRYMRQLMIPYGVDPLVLPNGLAPECFLHPDAALTQTLRERHAGRLLLTKVARFDPDKRWLWAMDAVAALKKTGRKPLLVARGGLEDHGLAVLAQAASHGLRVVHRTAADASSAATVDAISLDTQDADVVLLKSHVAADARRVLLAGSDAVLANSSHEPFGLVGLETMAAGGLACTGYSGEDYAVPGENALVLQTNDPWEFVEQLGRLHAHPDTEKSIRLAGQHTAASYAWPHILQNTLLPRLAMMGALQGARVARA